MQKEKVNDRTEEKNEKKRYVKIEKNKREGKRVRK